MWNSVASLYTNVILLFNQKCESPAKLSYLLMNGYSKLYNLSKQSYIQHSLYAIDL